MTDASDAFQLTVGVIVVRRRLASPWVPFGWNTEAVLAGVPDVPAWTLLSETADEARFFAGAMTIDLHTVETANYRDNLASGRPAIWVALRPTDEAPGVRLLAITADPSEGEAFTEAGEDIVDQVPMPPDIAAHLADFIAEHHVERVFYKRRRDRADPEALARRRPDFSADEDD